jgi:subtilase family serine protease
LALSVDDPAANPYITAGGGTTLPGTQIYEINATGQLVTVNIPHERVWSWDYLVPLCDDLGYDPIDCGIFPVGGGGGVSVLFPVPGYQQGQSGLRTSEPKQSLVDETQSPPQTLYTLPARYAGRNLPDISFNADPNTGYLILYTSDQSGFGEIDFIGGTSFVAPQLAGVTALVDGVAGGRVGLLNFPLYELASWGALYSGRSPAARDITKGNNEYYKAAAGYDQATGLGVLDVANFAALFR